MVKLEALHILITLSLSGLTYAVIRWNRRRIQSPYPPGPKPFPIIGNLRQMPPNQRWLTYAAWGRQFGPMTYLNVAGQPLLVVNSHQVAMDLLERRGSIYSDRQRFVMTGELLGFNTSVILHGYNSRHKRIRMLLKKALDPLFIQQNYVHIQEKEAHQLLNRLLESPQEFDGHLRQNLGRVILQIAYGLAAVNNEEFIALNDMNTSVFSDTLTGYLVDFLPALRHIPAWFPGAKFKRDAKIWRRAVQKGRDLPFALVQELRAVGQADTSYCSALLDAIDHEGGNSKDEEIVKDSAATLYRASTDTTRALIEVLILAMLLFPDVQSHAQQELDQNIGSDRLPRLADRAYLPYLNAVLMEALRWHPVLPCGVPHRLMEDDVYNGYFIPAGTIVTVNAWAISRAYQEPEKFMPERFLTELPADTHREDAALDPQKFAFGYGRRSCPGDHLGLSNAWIVIASILAVFNIEMKKDISGNPVIPKTAFTSGLISRPEPFVCDFVPRSTIALQLVKDSVLE